MDIGLPQVYDYWQEGKFNVLVMDLLGKSLEDLFVFCRKRFDLKTCLMIARQMVTRIQFLHSKRFIHRDIKPDNFVIGTGKNTHKIYIIDFGLSKKYISSKGVHIPMKTGKSLTGTARYCSINTHKGLEQSRRDDLEGFMYVLYYLLLGRLPW